jgi:PKD repeat protein
MNSDHRPRSIGILPAALLLALVPGTGGSADAQEPPSIAWRFSLPSGGFTTSSVTLVNRCRDRHRFRVEKAQAEFASVELPDEGVVIPPSGVVERGVRFDATGLAPEIYRGELVVICTDCFREPGCTQDRESFGIEMTVAPLPTEIPEFQGLTLHDGVLAFGGPESFAAALRQLDGIPRAPEPRRRVLEAVEARLGHTSLRRSLAERRSELAGVGRLSEMNDPDNHFVQDEALRILLNEHGEIRVANSIYHLWEQGLVVEVPAGNVEILEKLHSGDLDPHGGETEGFTLHAQPRKTGDTTGCAADFSVSVVTGTTIQFTNQSTGDQPLSYLWDFGDGSGTVSTASPSHTFPSTQVSTVCLQIVDGAGCMDTVCRAVNNSTCYAHFTVKVEGQTAQFTNTSLGDTLTYTWTFGDGDTSTAVAPVHTYKEPSDYDVCLRASNAFGCNSSYCEFIEVSNGECCDRNDRVRQKWTYYDNGSRRIKSVLWQTNLPFLYHRWGARTKHEAVDNQGQWQPQKVDAVHVLGGGTLYKRGPEGACSLPAATSWDQPAENADETHFNVPVGEQFWTRRDSLHSIHYVVFDGQSAQGAFLSLSSDCARKNCKKSCRAGKKVCKTTCKETKQVCKTTCKDDKSACMDKCSGLKGKKKRECRRACRQEKRSCKSECRQEKRGCTEVCREGKTECTVKCKE